jgi:hypothetical protein
VEQTVRPLTKLATAPDSPAQAEDDVVRPIGAAART